MTKLAARKAEALRNLEHYRRLYPTGGIYTNSRMDRTDARGRQSGPAKKLLTLVWRVERREYRLAEAEDWQTLDVLALAAWQWLDERKSRSNVIQFPGPPMEQRSA